MRFFDRVRLVFEGVGIAFDAMRANTPIPTAVPASAIITALAAAAATGIVFGMLPATRAARLDPVEALRYE